MNDVATRTRAYTVRRITNAEQWNRLVLGFAGYDFKQAFEWGEVRRAHGWMPTRVGVFEDDECVAACALLTRKIPGLGALVYAPRGPLFHAKGAAPLARLFAEVESFAKSVGAIVVRLSPGISTDDESGLRALSEYGFVELPEPWTTWNTPRHVQVLDLTADEKMLLAGMRRRLREYVGAAQRRGIVVEACERDDDLVAFHHLMVNVGKMKGFPVRDLGYYRALVSQYRRAGALNLLIARAGDTVVGGLLGVHFGRRAYLLYTSVRANTVDQVKHHVAPAISWEFIRRARAEGCELADFGGSGVLLPPQQSDPGWGVYHFKAGLGCRLETFVPFQDLVLRPRLYRLFRLAETTVLPQLWTLMSRVPRLVPRIAGAAA
jgi:lipid II:glycine glycyltransferase (peptidoglycan interpeptide bridge formation enzyme)